MSNSRLDNIKELYQKKVDDYQSFKQNESVLNAKASIHIQQMKETLATIPSDILDLLGLQPPVDTEEMTYEQMEEYSKKVETVLDSLTVKIEKYLETSDVEYLRGIESVVGLESTPDTSVDINNDTVVTGVDLGEMPTVDSDFLFKPVKEEEDPFRISPTDSTYSLPRSENS